MRRQLLEAGWHRNAIARAIHQGRLHPTYPGVYAVGTPAATQIERAWAAVLACGDRSVTAGFWALAHWGFTKRWPEAPEVVSPHNRRPRGIVVHRWALAPRERTWHLGVPVTSAARTVLDCAPRLGPQLTRTVDDGLHSFLKIGHLEEVCAGNPLHPGTKLILPFLSRTDGPSRSDWGAAFPDWCVAHGLPRPEMEARIGRRRVDARFVAERVIVELDSWEFHNDRRAFEDDRERDAAHLALGYVTVRITWDRQHGAPEAEAERLDRILRARRAELRRPAA